MSDSTADVSSAHAQVAMNALMDFAEPQPKYRAMAEQNAFLEVEGLGLTFSKENTDFVLRHHELFTSNIQMNLGNVRPLIPLNVDPPDHSNFRRLLDPIFAPKRMDEQEADIAQRANGFIDAFIDRGECNFSDEFAELFPASVFLGLCGLPESEMKMFLRMRDGILHPEKMDPVAATDVTVRTALMSSMGQEIYEYFSTLIDERRRRPSDDLASRFLAAEVGGQKLSKEDILDIFFLLVIAGLDTVSDSLTCFFAFLARHPAHRQQIVTDPAIIPSAVEELLRWESPVPHSAPKVATQDVELPGGQKVPKGCPVLAFFGAANVDEGTCPMPFEVKFDRQVNPHIAFGGGVHRCLGSHLARRELRIALREWHRRIPDYRLKPGHEQLEYPIGMRHVKDLTLSWG